VSVIFPVADAFPTAPRLSALPVLSILSVAEWVWLCWPTRVAKCYPAGPSRDSFNPDKVFQSSKFDCGSRRGSLTSYFTSTSPREDWIKKSAKSVYKQKKWFLTLLESLKPKIFQTPLEISQNLCSSRNTCRTAGKKVVSSPLQDRQKWTTAFERFKLCGEKIFSAPYWNAQ